MRIGRSRMRQASIAAATRSLPSGLLIFGELDDEDGVLAGEADQHHEADLGQDIVVHAAQPDPGDGAEQTQGHDQNDGQRQHPAFVLRRKHQEDEQHADGKDEAARRCRRGFADTPGRSTQTPYHWAAPERPAVPWWRWPGRNQSPAPCRH